MSIRFLLSLIASGAMLAACGQRGALYLPEEDRNVVVSPAASAAPAATPAADPAPATTEPTEEQRRNGTAPAK